MSAGSVFKGSARRAGLRRQQLASQKLHCERLARAVLSPRQAPPGGRILCYHAVGTPAWGVNDLAPRRFVQQMQWLLGCGYRIVPVERIARRDGSPRDVAITFDDNLASIERNAAPLLAELGVPWTLFMVTDWAGGRHGFGDGVFLGWAAIERLAAEGATIGSHSVSHPNFSTLSEATAIAELERSAWTIERRLGLRPAHFAIPFGRARHWNGTMTAAARAAGYRFVYAEAGRTRPAGTVPRTSVTRYDGARLFAAALGGAFDRGDAWARSQSGRVPM